MQKKCKQRASEKNNIINRKTHDCEQRDKKTGENKHAECIKSKSKNQKLYHTHMKIETNALFARKQITEME